MDSEFRSKAEEKAYLSKIIKEWNASRLDMFALTDPNEDLEFHGIMRFYHQDAGAKVVTKCIRVSSKQTVGDLMDTLVEKFCPDMKMLTTSNYEMFELHPNGDARKIGKMERPLVVQLGWHKDDREGRFLLKSANMKMPTTFFEIHKDEGQLKRRLSRREKKELKKKRKEEAEGRGQKINDDSEISQQLYNEVPETSLTRSISNPEAVMKRRRQQKLEKRLKEFQGTDGQQTGGTMKIFAESLRPEIPYKTILASVRDQTGKIVKDALEKFQLEKEDPNNYCLVMAVIAPNEKPGSVGKERVVRDDDCPLAIQSSWPSSRGTLTFHLRKRYTVHGHKDRWSKQKGQDREVKEGERLAPEKLPGQKLPYLMEMTPKGDDDRPPKIFHIKPNVTTVGSNKKPDPAEQYMQLIAPSILRKHCVIANIGDVVSITPSSSDAMVHVDKQRIMETTVLMHGSVVMFGQGHVFRYCDPLHESRHDKSSGSAKELNDSGSLSDSSKSIPREEAPPIKDDHFHKRDERPASYSGPSPYSPPLSPLLKEQILNEQIGSRVDDDMVVETTFGVDGEIESSPVRKTLPSSEKGFSKSSVDVSQVEKDAEKRIFDIHFKQSAPDIASLGKQDHSYLPQPRDLDIPLLPAALEFIDEAQDAFFAYVISEVNGAAVHFKLAPTYTLYLACRYMMSPDYRPELGGAEHARVVSLTTRKMAMNAQSTVHENEGLAGSLAFWMANGSELLHFLKQDLELASLTQTAQGILAQSTQNAFRFLVTAMEDELNVAMEAFLDPSENVDIRPHDLDDILNDDLLERADSRDLLNWTADERTFHVKNGRPGDQWISPAARIRLHGQAVMADVLYILSSAMSLLRRCRVNAALTIQLFSQLFHFINKWLFNKLVTEPQLGLCTRSWGHRLRRRLGYVEAWAERQGLELAADCHLCRVIQAAHLLEAPKVSAEDIASISSTCFKLNSLQLRALLKFYRPDRSEPIIPPELIDSVAAVAENTADELTRSDGREVCLEEDEELQLPFLLPEDGYSCDIIRGVPPGLQEFLEPLINLGMCRLTVYPTASGLWTVYQESFHEDLQKPSSPFSDQPSEEPEPEVLRVTLKKGKGGLGLSIVAAKGPNAEHLGIYIKAVVPGGAADRDGHLQAGDQILSVNGNSLVGVSQEKAAEYMVQTGTNVILEIAKQAAVFHGLATLLNQPSPSASPGPDRPGTSPKFDGTPTIAEQSPQIATQRWLANGNDYELNPPRGKYEQEDEEEDERRALEEERLRQKEEENRRAEEQRRWEEEMRLQEEEDRRFREAEEERRRIEEERMRAEEMQLVEEERQRLEEERLRIEEERKMAEELERKRREEEEKRRREEEERLRKEEEERLKQQREEEERQRKLEERQRAYEARIRMIEQQEEARRKKSQEEAERQRKEQEESERRSREHAEAERRREQEAAERRRREQEAERRKREQEEAAWRRREQEEEERRRREQEEADRRRSEESYMNQQPYRASPVLNVPDIDDLPPPPEDLLMDDRRTPSPRPRQPSPRPAEDQLQDRIRVQLAAEQREHEKLELEQRRLVDADMDEYGETNIDDVDDEELERQIRDQKKELALSGYTLPGQTDFHEPDRYSPLNTDEDIEREFQRRLEEEKQKEDSLRRAYEGTDDQIELERRRVEREYRMEQERKLQLLIHDHERRTMIRKSQKQEEDYNGPSMVGEQEKRLQRMNINQDKQKEPDDWYAQQRMRREKQRQELLAETKRKEEEDRQRRIREVKQRKEQEEKMMKEYQKQKDIEEQRQIENRKREAERLEREKQRRDEELRIAREKQQQVRLERERRPVGNGTQEEIVRDEFKEKAVADYERRRQTLDRHIQEQEEERRRRNFQPSTPPAIKPKPKLVNRNEVNEDDDDAPPRPPPPSAVPSTGRYVRSPTSPDYGDSRFNYRANSYDRSYTNRTPPISMSSRTSSSSSYTGAIPYRSPDDPANLDFRSKLKRFGTNQ